ncbi:MAG: phosphoenolpyruvate synthase [Patescibacteria group bacterium]|nr:phosphoenolpyruvate synthase [Patescibacteria group bacterium]MDD5164019.1 phosphoenolpyruvate synthase [Patescibacteria group bacterium]MDD5534897.1 phosphoenolpyruvate synthase [Patescibacteria group bacterium]
MTKKLVIPFKDLTIKDVPRVGGKNASLGEMYQKLTKKGIRIPNGFATTSDAYWYFLDESGLKKGIKEILKGLDVKDMKNLMTRGKKIRELILKSELSQDLKSEIVKFYKNLSKEYGVENVDVAVRSSATAEDLPGASFAGQQETFLNIHGEKELLIAVLKCIASLFTDRAIVYRTEQGFDHLNVALSVGVQKMIRSDLSCSGVMFSCDTESGFADVTVINSSWGLGENVVQGKVSPDEFIVYEPLNKGQFKPIVSKKLGLKEWTMTYDNKGNKSTKNLRTAFEKQNKFTLTDEEVLELARYSVIIEEHYKRPMDMEWAKDGHDKKLYVLQARPETIQSKRSLDVLEEYVLSGKEINSRTLARGKKFSAQGRSASGGSVLTTGVAIGSKIGTGEVNIIKTAKDISKFKPGQILVTEMTDPDWVPIMKIAKAIVTDAGGRVCHAAIVSRELGIPCVVGTGNATQKIHQGQKITVSCSEGEQGFVYNGLLPFKIKKTVIKGLKRPKTKIMMNVGDPEQAFAFGLIPNDGVGLAREEFIINDYIKIHPLALIHYSKIKDKKIKEQINKITIGYSDKVKFYVDKLAEGIAHIGAAFYPKDVIVRFSDFKTNEYANLVGGSLFEPTEANPMIGWRGASRYYGEKFKPAFELECQAIKKVREVMGLDNVIVMVPFCRTVKEGEDVLKIIDQYGLRKNKKGIKPLKVYVMCEIPSNVILGEEFAKIFDGFSIGSNDLTQLTLGLDRDSALVAHLFDERNEAVKRLVKKIIEIAHQYKRKVGICGQAPSDFPDFAEFLVKEGIDSISLNPDTVVKTTMDILKTEKNIRPKADPPRAEKKNK